MDQSPTSAWVTIPRAAEVLGVGTRAVRTLIGRRALTCRSIPGSYPRVLLEDVERLAAESTVPANMHE